MSVQRFSPYVSKGDSEAEADMDPVRNGDYVRFSDYEDMEAEKDQEIKVLQKKIDDAISSLN